MILQEIWGRVRPSKDEERWTTMPPSKEMEKTLKGKQEFICT